MNHHPTTTAITKDNESSGTTTTLVTTSLGGPLDTTEEPRKVKDCDVTDPPWGWVVTFAAFTMLFLSLTPTMSFGVLFSDFLLDLGTSSTLTTWIFNLAMFFSGVLTYLAGPLVDEFGWRTVAFVSGFVMGVGMIISGFTTSASYLLFSFSFLTGANMMVLVSVSYLVTSHYIVRWRVVANSLMSSGACVSQMVMPPVITLLQEEFGFKGATIITGALMLNCCVAAMVLHPVEWHRKDVYQPTTDVKEKLSSVTYSIRIHDSLRRIKSTVVHNLMLLKNPIVIIVSTLIAVNIAIIPNIFSMVPFAMMDSGFSQRESSLCLSMSGGCNLVARIMTSLLPCCPRVPAKAVIIAGTILIAIMVVGMIILIALI